MFSCGYFRTTALAVGLLLCSLHVYSVESTVSPLANSVAAAAEGKSLFLVNCQQCHDADGRALANVDFVAANLTEPDMWFYGSDSYSIFNTIKNGAGLLMPPFSDTLDDDQIWKIVAHVRSIGPQDSKPTEE